MIPRAVGREQGDIGNVANAVVRDADDTGLPGRLRIALARSAYHSGNGWRAGGTSAGTAAASNSVEECGADREAIAEAVDAISGQDALGGGDQHAETAC